MQVQQMLQAVLHLCSKAVSHDENQGRLGSCCMEQHAGRTGSASSIEPTIEIPLRPRCLKAVHSHPACCLMHVDTCPALMHDPLWPYLRIAAHSCCITRSLLHQDL